MGRLVSAVADLRPFVPSLLPQLKRISEDVADPDVRAVAARAHGALAEVATADRSGQVRKELRAVLEMAVTEADVALAGATAGGRQVAQTPCPAYVRDVVLDHVVLLCLGLGRTGSAWRSRLTPLLESAMPGAAEHLDIKELVASLRSVAERLVVSSEAPDSLSSDSEEAIPASLEAETHQESLPLLCDCTFTLACGASRPAFRCRLGAARRPRCSRRPGCSCGAATCMAWWAATTAARARC